MNDNQDKTPAHTGGFEPLLEEGEDWRETLQGLFPNVKLEDDLLSSFSPSFLLAAPLEQNVVGAHAIEKARALAEIAPKFFEAYKALGPQLRDNSPAEIPRLIQRLEFLFTGQDPLTGLFPEDPPRPWQEGRGELERLEDQARKLPSFSLRASKSEALEKARLADVARRSWHMLRSGGGFHDPADLLQAPRSVAVHQEFHEFLEILIRWAGKRWSPERTLEAWRKVNPK